MKYGTGRKHEPLPCIYRGKASGEHVTLKCRVGGVTQGKSLAVVACEVFGECLPDYRCNKQASSEILSRDVAVCKGCEHRDGADALR